MRRALRGAMSASTREERRLHRRVRLKARAELDDGSSVQPGRCVDLSIGGLSIASSALPESGALVRVSVERAPGQWVQTVGQVVRTGAGVTGVRFTRLDQRALTSIFSRVAAN